MRYTDPDLMYCPKCDEEYRAEIVMCAACNVELIGGGERLAQEETQKQKVDARSMAITNDDELANVRKGSLHDMKQLQTLLAKENIPSLLAGDGGSGKGCCGDDLYLQIKVSDAEDAMRVLADDFKVKTSLDSHDLSTAHAVFDTGAESSTCPACGFSFSTSSSTCPDCGLCF